MNSLLDQLYRGDLHPTEHMLPRDPAYPAVNHALSEKQQIWEKALSEEERAEWDALEELRIRAESMERSSAFSCGFCLGARLMMEVLTASEMQD